MKTKEEILKDLTDPIREAVLSAITPIISNAMSMHSDQQNKDKDAEIQRLTKEVEELKKQVNGWAYTAGTYQNELTRLRELLEKCYRHIDTIPDEEIKLLKEIDNALNHKP